MNSSKSRDILIGIVVLIFIILVAIYFIRKSQNPQTLTDNASPMPLSTYEQQLQNNFGITVPSSAVKADLSDVTGGNQIGLVTLDKTNGQSVYTVIANLNDPTPGYFYEAWLVNNTDVVLIGKLSVGKGGWILNYTSSLDLSDHKKVWITMEKLDDKTPEKHILEGSF